MSDEDLRNSPITVEEFWWASAFLVKTLRGNDRLGGSKETLAIIANALEADARALPSGRLKGIVLGMAFHMMHFEESGPDKI